MQELPQPPGAPVPTKASPMPHTKANRFPLEPEIFIKAVRSGPLNKGNEMSLCQTGPWDGQGLTSSGVEVNPSLPEDPRAPPCIPPEMEISLPHPGAMARAGLCWALLPGGIKLSQALLTQIKKKRDLNQPAKMDPKQSQREHIFISQGYKRKGRKPDPSQITLLSLAVI